MTRLHFFERIARQKDGKFRAALVESILRLGIITDAEKSDGNDGWKRRSSLPALSFPDFAATQ